MIKLSVGNVFTNIDGFVPSDTYQKLRKEMSFHPEGYEFSTLFNKWIFDKDGNPIRRMWDGYRRQIWKTRKRNNTLYFPTGLLSIVRNVLIKDNLEFQLLEHRSKPAATMHLEFDDSFKLRDYQQPIVVVSCELQRGIIQVATGGGKCLGKGTSILMFDGSIKTVENIVTGDLLMSPDSKPRSVLSVASGVDDLYKIKPKRGEAFVVNASHILSLRMTNGSRRDGEIVNIPVYEYLKQNKFFKHCAKGYRSQVNFTEKEVPIDPYFLGLWLGDGRSTHPEISTIDSEIVEYLEKFASSLSMKLNKKTYGNKCPQYAIVSEKKSFIRRTNELLNSLRKLEVVNNKHIPHIYKTNSRSVRLKILSGLMDSDGSLHNGGYDYISKYEQLANDVAYLSRSLGLRAIVTPCSKTCSNTGSIGKYFRVSISGDCSVIPVKITRKKAHKRKQKKNCLHFGFEVEPIGKGEYYGFEIDGDRLFMLGDFTVTHNTAIAEGIIKLLGVKPFIFFVTSIDLLTQAKESFEEVLRENGKPIIVGQIGGGVIDIRDINVMTIQTAVRALGEKYVKFDRDDTDDKTPIENRREDILNLLTHAKATICDECISGDATVITRQGLVPMRKLNKYIGKDILSFDGNSVVWKKITHFYPKEKNKTLEITLENGNKIKCTENHPIMTKQGWKLARKICHKDQILCCVNVDVNKKFASKEEVQASTLNIFLDTRSKNDQQKNGKKYLIKQQKQHRAANVDVGNKLNYTQERLSHLSTRREALNITVFSMDTTSVHRNGICDYLNLKSKQFLGRYLEIHLFPSHLKEAKTRESMPIMDYANLNGQNSNQIFSVGCLQGTGNTITEDTEINQPHLELAVIQKLRKYTTPFFTKTEKESQNNGLTASERSDLHGGYVMTDRAEKIILKCIPRVSQKKKFISSENGSQKNMDQRQYTNQKGILPCILKKKQEIKLFPGSKSISQITCDTNYTKVKSISYSKEKDVFDITVEDTHCFFANNILVHNCQHWRAETCQLVTRSLKESYYIYGCSATPYRDEGDDLMIHACFGKKIAEIDASQLIKEGWLIKPNIKIVHVRGPRSPFRQWQQLYKDQVSENVEYNTMISNIANSYIKNNRIVLVLVQQIAHGKRLASAIPGSIFLSGKSSKKKRQEGINQLRKRKISCIISTVIFDEGIDVRPLDTLLLAGQGKSRVRAMQRIGRILRPFEGKTAATAIDFRIHQKYLLDHSIEREKMYRTESEYEIEEIDI